MYPWSCDTFVAMPDATSGQHSLMGKNSDRPVFDSQPLRYFARREGTQTLQLAYVTIDDVAQTHAHLGGSPYWCWGHELGVNEWHVAIGNEALFTRDLAANRTASTQGQQPPWGILGMELVRLGLERGRTAEEALSAMCLLIERYGQWGSGVPCAPLDAGAYDNSYLIADPTEAWVLETSGRQWAAKAVRRGTWAISNQMTIRDAWDKASADVVEHAAAQGWWPEQARPFDFARAYTDPGTPLQVSHVRLQRSRQLLHEATTADGVDVEVCKRILRDHYESTFLEGPYFNAALPDFLTLCMHAHPAGFTWGNTASSAVFVLPRRQEGFAHMWWTPLTPCTGVYLPVFVAAGDVPHSFTVTGPAGAQRCPPEEASADVFDERSYWWRFHELLEAAKGGDMAWCFEERQPIVRQAFDPLERRWAGQLPEVEAEAVALRRKGDTGSASKVLARFTRSCADEATRVLGELIDTFAHDAERVTRDPQPTRGV